MKQSLPKVIPSRETLSKLLASYRKKGKKIVFTNGCFDIIHAGHVAYLEKAHRLGDVLIVGVNTDGSVRKYKGDKRPINPLPDRIRVLSALKMIDHIVAFKENTPSHLLEIIRPDYDVKGGDYTVNTLPEAPVVKQYGGKVVIIPFYAHHSTTRIIKKIMEVYGK
jgi:D-beta-D-heptose 7-phosphate kinase/D-beta-D-heptose 1-phosphate adenosyltransferase